jgi:predicted metal-dependent hydrolase
MIKEIILDNTIIKYQITRKNNKNTYFYFKKKGYIQINASKHQREKDIIKFMKTNSSSFVKKYNKSLNAKKEDRGYRIWGIRYNIIQNSDVDALNIDYSSCTIIEPFINIDQLEALYKDLEKNTLLEEAIKLKDKYVNNGLIDISNIMIKTRSTTTRFGSCNHKLKTINLNLKLVHYDKKFLEYVFLHEIAHLIHQNHSSDFYLLLSKLCPNYKDLKKELNIEFNR